MATPIVAPREAGEGGIGNLARPWGGGFFKLLKLVGVNNNSYPFGALLYRSDSTISQQLQAQEQIITELSDPVYQMTGGRRFYIEGVLETSQAFCNATIGLKAVSQEPVSVKELNIRVAGALENTVRAPFAFSLFYTKPDTNSITWQITARTIQPSTLYIQTVELVAYL